MDVPKSEVVELIYQLLPGFLAAWVFYGLTAHPQKSPFERTIQALIFTGLVRTVTLGVREAAFLAGRIKVLSIWSKDVEFVWSFALAVALGLLMSYLANSNILHRGLAFCGITKRTSFPSEWFSALNEGEKWVYLHLKGDRRLYGFPKEWPDSPASGHFVLVFPEWILDDNSRVPLLLADRIVIPVTDIEMVEIEKPTGDWKFDPKDQKRAEEKLISLRSCESKEDAA